jgi:membrane associated rhomboid family serine protease
MSPTVKSGLIRAVRAFIAAFIVIYPVSNLIGAASGSQPIDTSALRAAAVAGLIAAVAFVWRTFLDPLPVPTLADKNPAPQSP